MTPEARKRILTATCTFHKCPTTATIVEGLKHDDKVFCVCGKTHPKALMASASAEEYIAQEELRRARIR